MRPDSRTSLERASWVTSVRTRREDRSLHRRLILSQTSAGNSRETRLSIISLLLAVPLSEPGGRSFVPACGCEGVPRARARRATSVRGEVCTRLRVTGSAHLAGADKPASVRNNPESPWLVSADATGDLTGCCQRSPILADFWGLDFRFRDRIGCCSITVQLDQDAGRPR
jgi:hypothetical protein